MTRRAPLIAAAVRRAAAERSSGSSAPCRTKAGTWSWDRRPPCHSRLPACAPDLNPAEGAWANMKNGLGNLLATDVDQFAAIVKNRLNRIQRCWRWLRMRARSRRWEARKPGGGEVSQARSCCLRQFPGSGVRV